MRPACNSSLCLAAISALFLASCGGGGGGSDAAPAPVVTPPTNNGTPVPGAPYAAGTPQASAFAQLNAARSRCGFGELVQATELDTSAAAHAYYMAVNSSFAHEEVAGKPGFTGVQVWDRETAAGYSWSFSGEVLAQVESTQSGADAVRELMAVPYHAALLMDRFHDVGFGWSTVGRFFTLTGDLGTRIGQSVPAPSGVLTYPCNGVTDAVPVAPGESPSPFPTNPSATWGQSIIVRGPSDLLITGASVTGPAGSVQILAIYGAGQAADQNMTGDFTNGAATVIPAPLQANTTYSVTITYTTGRTSGRRDFSFTTGAR